MARGKAAVFFRLISKPSRSVWRGPKSKRRAIYNVMLKFKKKNKLGLSLCAEEETLSGVSGSVREGERSVRHCQSSGSAQDLGHSPSDFSETPAACRWQSLP